MDYDQLRKILVSSEGLYNLWQSSGLPEEDFIRANGNLIEEAEKNRLAKEKTQARQKRFIERQKADGKRTLTAIVSGDTYDRLTRIRDNAIQAGEKKSLGDVLDDLCNESKATGQDQGSQIREEPIKAIANQTMQDVEKDCRETPSTIETQNGLFDESDQDKPNVIKIMAGYRAAGDTWPDVADKLNARGIKPARAKEWNKANAQRVFDYNK